MTSATAQDAPCLAGPPPDTETAEWVDLVKTALITVLAPMFLGSSGGDSSRASRVVAQLVNAYGARNPWELFKAAQIIAYGVCEVDSLSLSMADRLSDTMTLRLRGNAVSMSRAGAWHQKSIGITRRQAAMEAPTSKAHPPDDRVSEQQLAHEALVTEQVRQTRARAAEACERLRTVAASAAVDGLDGAAPAAAIDVRTGVSPSDVARTRAAEPAASEPGADRTAEFEPREEAAPPAEAAAAAKPTPTPLPGPAPVSTDLPERADQPRKTATEAKPAPIEIPPQALAAVDAAISRFRDPKEEHWRTRWANSMSVVAAEYTAGMASMTPAQRKDAAMRASALTSCANDLLSGAELPPGILLRSPSPIPCAPKGITGRGP